MIDGFIGQYRPFSNFWYATVRLDNIAYPTNEHAYQAAKTLDYHERFAIAQAETPGKAKALGKNVQLRPDWNSVKRKVMLNLVRQKFQYTDLQQLLLSTGTQKLIERNVWHDNYWGVCSCQGCEYERHYEDPLLGKNWLGKILMLVRMELQIEKGI